MEDLEVKKEETKKKTLKKTLFIVFGFLIVFFLFGKYTIWQIEQWKKTLPGAVPKIEIEELQKIPQFFSPENFPLPFSPEDSPFPFPYIGTPSPETEQTSEYKTFISQDGKLKIEYPANWLKLETESLQKAFPEELVKNYQLKLLFLAQKFDQTRAAQLIVNEMIVDTEIKIEELVEEIKNLSQKQGWEIVVVYAENKGEEFVLETMYRKQNYSALHSKGKILSLPIQNNQTKIFWVEISALDKDWGQLKEEVDKILETAQLVE